MDEAVREMCSADSLTRDSRWSLRALWKREECAWIKFKMRVKAARTRTDVNQTTRGRVQRASEL